MNCDYTTEPPVMEDNYERVVGVRAGNEARITCPVRPNANLMFTWTKVINGRLINLNF